MLYIFGATAAALIVFASRKGNRSEPSVRELEVRAAKLKAAARKVDSSAAAVDAALKPLMIA